MLIRSPKELALHMQAQRKKLKLSQTAAASIVGLQQKTLSAFENKPEHIQLKTLFLLLSALNLELRLESKHGKQLKPSGWKEEW